MRRGDVVRLRSPAEILRTLDAEASLEGVPFMPEMLAYFGRRFTVSSRVERACDAVSRVRRMPDTVLLDDLRCDGAGHGGCQAGCRIYWKEAWLQRDSGEKPPLAFSEDEAYVELRARATRHTRRSKGDGVPPKYRCQATEFLQSSDLIGFWDVRSLLREVKCGNVSVRTLLRVFVGIIANERRRRYKGPRPFLNPGNRPPTTRPIELEPGSRVRIRSAPEIENTLDPNNKLRGLWFDREMVPYCDTQATVKAKVERFIDENSGEMVELTSDCYILDGVVCKGLISDGRWLCCRGIYPWWREAWLEQATDAENADDRAAAGIEAAS